MSGEEEAEVRPSKRIRLDDIQDDRFSDETRKEIRVGITAFVSPELPGFSGTLKRRYTDFLVNEILPSGEVLYLEGETYGSSGTDVPKRPELEGKTEQKAGEKNGDENNPEKSSTVAKDVDDDSVDVEIPEADKQFLVEIFGDETTKAILSLFGAVLKNPNKKKKHFRKVTAKSLDDKETRTKAHQAIRRIFDSKLDSNTNQDNTITISATGRGNQAWQDARSAGAGHSHGKLGWQDLGGEYLHFTLYKENKDTMEVVSYLASQLKLHTRNFQYAGTKDRRAVTVQRLSALRLRTDRLIVLGRNLRNAVIGGFKHEDYPLKLGDLSGNEFVITLRDCHFPGEAGLGHLERKSLAEKIVYDAIKSLGAKGFINFYGLQRFGSFDIGTDEIGRKLLQGDLEAAVKCIISYSPTALAAAKGEVKNFAIPTDDKKRALAIHTWEETGDSQKALEIMPRKFSAEVSIIRHLGLGTNKTHAKDWQGALSGIQRNLRLMYVHAYQSLVWNTVASERWTKYGDEVVEGDLVIDSSQNQAAKKEEVDQSGEVVILPAANDRAFGDDSIVRARPLTKDDIKSGRYTIWDIMLTLPGYDVIYPANEIGQFYKDYMGSEAGGKLDPHDMRRKWKDISLTGGYRKFLAKPAGISGEVKSYTDDEQLVQTDVDRINGTERPSRNPAQENDENSDQHRLAVILKLQLGSSQYATMALRELLKSGGIQSYKAEFANE